MNSKQKGASFERDIARRLSLWLTNGKKADCLWRSAMSGGRATMGKRRGEDIRQCGDLCAVAPEAHEFMDQVYIEIKHLKQIDIKGLITGKGTLMSVWRKTVDEAVMHSPSIFKDGMSVHRIPILIIRQNMWPILLCTTRQGGLFLHFKWRICHGESGMELGLLDDVLNRPRRRRL